MGRPENKAIILTPGWREDRRWEYLSLGFEKYPETGYLLTAAFIGEITLNQWIDYVYPRFRSTWVESYATWLFGLWNHGTVEYPHLIPPLIEGIGPIKLDLGELPVVTFGNDPQWVRAEARRRLDEHLDRQLEPLGPPVRLPRDTTVAIKIEAAVHYTFGGVEVKPPLNPLLGELSETIADLLPRRVGPDAVYDYLNEIMPLLGLPMRPPGHRSKRPPLPEDLAIRLQSLKSTA